MRSERPDMLSNRESPPLDSRSGAGMTVVQRSLPTEEEALWLRLLNGLQKSSTRSERPPPGE